MDMISYDEIETLPIDPVEKYRIKMTISCKDCESIPKVSQAGKVFDGPNGRYQLMHNNLKVIEDGYCGRWMTELIKILRGHHEPQEEKAFYEILNYIPKQATMIELGSWWSYYSLWFQKQIEGAQNYMIEPDPSYLEIGKQNFALNEMTGHFFNAAIGNKSIASVLVRCESDNVRRPMQLITLDDFCLREGIKYVDLLLCDIQGFELEMLQGATKGIEQGLFRFMVISTHHHTISNDPLIHHKCLAFLQERGAHILVEHNISESYSGDGLIVASLSPYDRNLPVIEVSRNYSRTHLFKELEYDLADALEDKEKLRSKFDEVQTKLNEIQMEQDRIQTQLDNIYYSFSWRITKPLRQLKYGIRYIQRVYERLIRSDLVKPAVLRLISTLVKRLR